MNPSSIPKKIVEFSKTKKKFPDGRIDFTDERECTVITVFVTYKGKLLLMKRSNKVSTYRGKWMTVAGYYDEPVPIRQKVEEELREELGVRKYKSMEAFKPYKHVDKQIGKTWIIHSVLVELKSRPKIKLDWEHTELKWIDPKDLKKYDTVPSLMKTFKRVFG